LDDETLKRKWEDAVKQKEDTTSKYEGRLGYVKLEDVRAINDALRQYDVLTK
jgi:D-glycerate 3-kinase